MSRKAKAKVAPNGTTRSPFAAVLGRLGTGGAAALCGVCGLLCLHVLFSDSLSGPLSLGGVQTPSRHPDRLARKRRRSRNRRRTTARRSGAGNGTVVASVTDINVNAAKSAGAEDAGGGGKAGGDSGSASAAASAGVDSEDEAKLSYTRRKCTLSAPAQEERHRPELYFLDAVCFVRLQRRGPDANLVRWLQWMRYAGVERIYMYDTGYTALQGCAIDVPGVAEMVADNFLIIKKWDLARWPNDRQLQIWQDVNRRFPTHHWRMYLDTDEYLIAPNDTASGFAKRYLARMPQKVGVVQLHNFVFGGIDLLSYEVNVSEGTHALPERLNYRLPDEDGEADTNTKYIAHMSRTCSLSIYFARPCEGFKIRSTMPSNMRFNHYNPKKTQGAKLRLVEDRLIEAPLEKAAKMRQAPLPNGWLERARSRGSKDAEAEGGKNRKGGVVEDPELLDRAAAVRAPVGKRKCPPTPKAPSSHSPGAFFLDAAIYVRLTERMPYEILTDWLLWMHYAGVERIYLYDIGYLSTDKCVVAAPGIMRLVNAGFLVIKKWDLPKWPDDQQLHIWRDVNGRFPTSQWRMYLSVEEYLFSAEDTQSGFARRYLQKTSNQVGSVQMQNFVFSGDADDVDSLPRDHQSWPERHIQRVGDSDAAKDFRTKYVAHMQRTCALLIHTARPCDAYKLRKPLPDKLRFNTYEISWRPEAGDDKLVTDKSLSKVFRKAIESSNKTFNKRDGLKR
eukprot:TRINITY_DN45754_c0_g1_i1.p1 TRINITY_DN45754_c0_g1~~TRINITY_DN45754_c0_g1_i1.p1  ORF type:complete len:730 (+),score=120.64 TRINITY_DN45754_c0_g1_i1:55-2244(+)